MSEAVVVVEENSKMSEVDVVVESKLGDEEKQAKMRKMRRGIYNKPEEEKRREAEREEKKRREAEGLMSEEEKKRKVERLMGEEEAKRLMRWSVNIRRVVIVLAALEQAATRLAQIAFLGATVVLLGGYATRLKLYDFKLISALLLSEGVRVFLASQNAEYTRAIGGEIAGNWGPGLCGLPWLISWGHCFSDTTRKRNLIMTIFQVLQVGSAAVTFAFSLSRLKSGNYKPTLSSPSDAGELANFVYGIRLFYILTLVESSVFLVVKAVGWELLALLLSVGKIENGEVLFVFALKIYGVFLSEGFGKASATNFLTFMINFILENQTKQPGSLEASVEELVVALGVLLWQIPEEDETTESIQCLIRLTAPGQPEGIRHCANQILARAAFRVRSNAIMFPVSEFGRIPLEVVDSEVIKFLDGLVRCAPLGFLPVEAVSKQASTFLIRSMFEGDNKIKAQAALTFLNWWSIPNVYRNYGFDPADIFYRLYIDRRQRVSVKEDLEIFNLEAAMEYEAIAEPIRTAFSQALKTPRRSDIMNKLLSRVDFSKLKNKQSTINLSGIVAEVIGAESGIVAKPVIGAKSGIVAKPDAVVGLVAAWIWFMDESTFEKAISNLTKEELGMLKGNTTMYRAILSKVPAFSI